MPDVCRIVASSMGLHVRRWQVRLAAFLQWTLGLEAVRRPIAETVQGVFGFRIQGVGYRLFGFRFWI